MRRTLLGVGCVVALVLPGTATAATVPFKGSRSFDVSIRGTEEESSSTAVLTDCYDPATDGLTPIRGTETYSSRRTFGTRSAATWRVAPQDRLFGRSGFDIVWRDADERRRELLAGGTEERTKTVFNCPAGQQRPTPVCGSKAFGGTVLGLATSIRRGVADGVRLEFLFDRRPPAFDETCESEFTGCGAGGRTAREAATAPVSYRRLGRVKRGGKLVLKGKGSQNLACGRTGEETRFQSTLTYTITLRRVR